jgi:hypothetical protein
LPQGTAGIAYVLRNPNYSPSVPKLPLKLNWPNVRFGSKAAAQNSQDINI